MHRPPPHPARRRPLRAAAALASGTLALSGLAVLGGSPASAAAAADVVSLFPSDALTVADPAQLTGRRVALPLPDCATRPTDCHTTRLLNELDGFDLDPRLAVRFDAPVDPVAVAAAMRVAATAGGFTTPVDRVVYDAATSTVYAHPQRQLAPGTQYRLVVQRGPGVPAGRSTFTTLSATDGLLDLRRQLDSGAADAGADLSAAARDLRVDAVLPVGTQITAVQDRGPLGGGLVRVPVPSLSDTGAASYVFGSYRAPSWLNKARLIPQEPTGTDGPRVRGADRLPFVLVLPAGTPPPGGWPVAVFGHGFGGSASNVLLAASQNAARGLATIGTSVVGHGYGPASTYEVVVDGQTRVLPSYGRGTDLDGNGAIASTEGSGTLPQPARFAQIGSRDGLRQTAADVMSLVRAVSSSGDLDGDGTRDLRGTGVGYYGQSFGGIYGTMLGGVDPQVRVLGLNVPGGPISEVVRLGIFRPALSQALGLARPPLLNGGVGGFTESLPLAGEPPVTAPAAGALAIQQFLADQTWLDRSGSPETFAPLLAGKRVLVQAAYGDATVPNPTTGTLVRAGRLEDRTSLYRNDLTPQEGANPHTFLLNPAFPAAFGPGNLQVSTFLASGGATVVDPDGAGPVWEVPVQDPSVLQRLNAPAVP